MAKNDYTTGIGLLYATNQYKVDFGFYSLDVVKDGITYKNTEVLGVKIVYRSNDRYVIIGSVLSGSSLGGSSIIYNSWLNKYVVL